MIMPKAIFWDNDGVLVDTEELYFKATQRVLADVGIALTEPDYIELFLIQGRGAFHLASERGMSPAEVERLRSDRNLLYGQWLAEAPRTMDDVRRVLEALHGRYVMGVVTSSRKDHFDIIHAQTGLLKYFDFVLTAADFARVKPDPEPYLRAVERSGFKAAECLAIEDSVLLARRECRALSFQPGSPADASSRGPRAWCRRLATCCAASEL